MSSRFSFPEQKDILHTETDDLHSFKSIVNIVHILKTVDVEKLEKNEYSFYKLKKIAKMLNMITTSNDKRLLSSRLKFKISYLK
ncbi:MAG: hypothetical protein KatS3mg101_0839 [Patescibacteria group bacterium]|nr:MAG: hypothetical protein KatS3mg101_0839 [Patescibacteria group bacterium]